MCASKMWGMLLNLAPRWSESVSVVLYVSFMTPFPTHTVNIRHLALQLHDTRSENWECT